jgi:two-component system response regulator AtoC
MSKILIIDDEELIRESLKRILTQEGYIVDTASNGKTAIEKFLEYEYNVVLLDINLPDINGITVLKQLKQIEPNVLVIMITGYASIEHAVKSIKLGAYDYIEKPLKKSTIKLIVKLALETQILKKEVQNLQKIQDIDFIGETKVIKDILGNVKEIAKHNTATVLITGESGTGKELIARSIHILSPRKDKPFIAINCASIPHNLLESELFGYEKGAFTNAFNRKIGVIEEADKGTLFLDEIGDLEFTMQSKILRFLEERSFRRIGGNKDINVDVRIIAATNQNLEELIKQGKFREDLFYRLNVFPIYIPPLRKRKDDIIPLVKYFINYYNKKFNKNISKIDEEVIEILKNYEWKGNVRELKNIIERIVLLTHDNEIKLNNLPPEFKSSEFILDEKLDFNKIIIPDSGISFKELEKKFNTIIIKKAIEKSKGNISKAAKLLNIPRETLRDRMKKFSIK